MQHSVTTKASSKLLSEKNLEKISHEEVDELIDEIALGIYFETHRAARLGYLFLDEDTDEDESHAIVSQRGFDVFGESIGTATNGQVKKQVECVCPHCSRSLAAQRFAPHLEKCMGMGRNSSRIASKRIASSSGKANGQDSDEVDDVDKDNGDSDWNYNASDTKKKKKKEKSNGLLKKATKKEASLKGAPKVSSL